MELLKQNTDLEKYNLLFYFLFWIGIAIHITGEVLHGLVFIKEKNASNAL